MTVFEYGGRLLIVDCGVLFPEEHQPGVDLILPDFSSIRDRLDDIDGIVLTHGHEDHIGAVPYLLREKPDIPLIGSKLTLALIEAKLQEHRIRPYTLEVEEGQRERIGPFDCEFLAVNHSIPDALAVAIRTPAGLVVHTGDFKMDQLPLDGRLTDLPRVRPPRRGGHRPAPARLDERRGARLHPARARDRPVLRQVFAHGAAPHHRGELRQPRAPGPAGAGRGPGVRPQGRLRRPLDGPQHGDRPRPRLPPACPAGLLVDLKTLDDLPGREVVLICTGSQGEPMAALARMANRDHQIRIAEGDTVILASSLIPGNENAVYRVINGLTRWGAQVVHKANAQVHVSGHASAGRAALLLQHLPSRAT